MNCEKWSCKSDEFSCGPTNRCIPSEWVCDGKIQCPNGLDENNCTTTCSNNTFYCKKQNICIPNSWKCDGQMDCQNGEDEENCECNSETEFKCTTGGGCIDMKNRCDGVENCADKSDEWNCYKFTEVNNGDEVDRKKLCKYFSQTHGLQFV